jgi:putative SOS response-associated peptidase YedK
MCGRFTLFHDVATIARAFNVSVPESLKVTPRYNVAPTQDILSIVNDETPQLTLLRWGLIPTWAKEESIGSKMINARAETLAEKPSFKRLLRSRRCLILTDGFYEWKKEGKGKVPMFITLKDEEPFAFAGLWDTWRDANGQQLRTCTIITTEANELITPIHNRMPVILPTQSREEWLDPSLHDEQMLLSLLQSYPAEAMTTRPVSRQVNNPQYDSAELIA